MEFRVDIDELPRIFYGLLSPFLEPNEFHLLSKASNLERSILNRSLTTTSPAWSICAVLIYQPLLK